MKIVVIERGRVLPKAEARELMLSVSRRMLERRASARAERADERNGHAPERQSVARAMLAVEDRLVRAFWTISRLPGEKIGGNGRCGIDYLREGGDLAVFTDAAGGKWDSVAPRPPIPGSKEIDQAKEALDWLLHADERYRRILVAGATSKRGDVGANVRWNRVRAMMPELHDLSARTLQHRYREALRQIVNGLTQSHLG